MRKSFGSRSARRVCRLVLATAAAMAVAQSGYAQTVTLLGFEGVNEFDVLGDPAQYTFTTGATTGATQGANSLQVDMLPTVQSGDPLDYQFSNLGVDYEGRGDILIRNQFSFDITVPAGQSTGTPVDLELRVAMQGSSAPNWGGFAYIESPSFFVPEGSTSMTLTFDYSALKGAFNGLVNNQWWQTLIQAKNVGENRTFYIDNLRTYGVDSAANSEWKNPAGGDWATATNWDPEAVPLNLDSTALLGTFGGVITGSPSINMNASPVLKTLTFDTPSGQGYTLNGGMVTIDASTNDGSVNVVSGQHTIAGGLTLNDTYNPGAGTLGNVINVAAGAQLTVGSFNAVWTDVAKTGDGTLIIDQTSNVGFQHQGGTLKFSADFTGAVSLHMPNAGSVLDIDGHLYMSQWFMSGGAGTTINLGTGGTMTFNNGGAVLDSDIVGSGEINVVTAQNVVLQGTASTFVAPLNITNATLTVNNGGALGDAGNAINLTDSTFATTGPVFGYGHAITISGTSIVDTQTHQVYTGIVSGGGLTKMGAGTFSPFKVTVPGQQVTVAGGVLQIPANGTNDATSVMGYLSLDDGMGGTGSFDLTNNKAIVQFGDVTTVRSQIIAGYNAGSWDGVGIVSSTALATPGTAIGYADAGSIGLNGGNFGGIGVNTGNVVMAYTLQGDSNIDFTVDSVDWGYFIAGYGKLTDALWVEGDYNYDGKVTTEDFNFLAGNYGQSLTFPAAALGAVVPEPSSVLLLAAPLLLGLGRRRR